MLSALKSPDRNKEKSDSSPKKSVNPLSPSSFWQATQESVVIPEIASVDDDDDMSNHNLLQTTDERTVWGRNE